MIVRSATADDLPEIVRILRDEMFPEIGFGSVSMPRGVESVCEVLRDGVIWLVCGDEIMATTGLIPSRCWWWSDDEFVVDRWVFVRKQYRKSRAAITLLNTIRKTAAKSPLPVLISISSPYDTTAKERLFSRYGDKVGNFFKIRPLEG